MTLKKKIRKIYHSDKNVVFPVFSVLGQNYPEKYEAVQLSFDDYVLEAINWFLINFDLCKSYFLGFLGSVLPSIRSDKF